MKKYKINGLELTLRKHPRISDIQDIQKLIAETGFFRQDEVDIAVELIREGLEKGPDSDYRFLMANADHRLAGYTCFGLIPCSLVSWDLYWIVIGKQYQSIGLGSLLLQLTETEIRKSGGWNIIAETSGKTLYAPTRHFYAKNNYLLKGQYEDFYAEGDDKLVYMKRLR